MPGLFPDDPVDTPALAAIAARSVPRDRLSGLYVCVAKSSDLFELGYLVAHWVRPGVPGSEVLEFLPRLSALPRLTVACHADQAAVHRAIGARVVSPGARFRLTGHATRTETP